MGGGVVRVLDPDPLLQRAGEDDLVAQAHNGEGLQRIDHRLYAVALPLVRLVVHLVGDLLTTSVRVVVVVLVVRVRLDGRGLVARLLRRLKGAVLEALQQLRLLLCELGLAPPELLDLRLALLVQRRVGELHGRTGAQQQRALDVEKLVGLSRRLRRVAAPHALAEYRPEDVHPALRHAANRAHPHPLGRGRLTLPAAIRHQRLLEPRVRREDRDGVGRVGAVLDQLALLRANAAREDVAEEERVLPPSAAGVLNLLEKVRPALCAHGPLSRRGELAVRADARAAGAVAPHDARHHVYHRLGGGELSGQRRDDALVVLHE